MGEKYIAINVDDPRTDKIADVISNKTCKKILSFLAEKEMSESELSRALNAPMNTISYNIKKLVDSGLVERTTRFLWSAKGRRMHVYKISNKKIMILPKKMMVGVIPAIIATGAMALGIKFFFSKKIQRNAGGQTDALFEYKEAAGKGASAILKNAENFSGNLASNYPSVGIFDNLTSASNIWAWFLMGALCALAVYLIWNYLKESN